jgi:Spy/CpxP family protein refolding chaperone
MKRDWLLYLVIFSLALNLGTIGTFTYLHYQDHRELAQPPPPPPFREIGDRLHLDQEQRQALQRLLPEHRRRVMELRQGLAQKRQELLALIKEEHPAWPPIAGKIREISDLQGKLEEEVVRFLLDIEGHLRPEQKTDFLKLVEQRMHHMGPPWAHRGHGRGMMGPGPGPGMGPGPAMGPHPGPGPGFQGPGTD